MSATECHNWKTCSNTETVFYSVNNVISPRRLLYLVCIAGVQWRSSFVFRSTRISSNSSKAFCWLTSLHDPGRGSFIQRILCLSKVTSFQSFEPTWKSFPSQVKTRCSISVPPVLKRSYDSYHGFSCSWTSCKRMKHFL